MANHVFEDARSFEVCSAHESVEVYVFDDGDVMVGVEEKSVWDSPKVTFTLTAEEATLMKEFLIRKGY